MDLAWESGRYGLAYRGLTDLAAQDDRAEVLWRQSRAAVSFGLAEADSNVAREHFLMGRNAGWRCLSQSAEFAQRRRTGGWADASEHVPQELAQCALWTAIAWLRWMEYFGVTGVELDATAIRGLLNSAEFHGAERSEVRWARALHHALLGGEGGSDPVLGLRL